jgi:type IV fimbrial biogenesis protein FimT
MPQRNAAGTTIAELLMCLSIVSALASTAIPALVALYWKIELSSTTSSLYNLVQSARHTALTQQTRVSICPLSPSGSCLKNWQQEISAFTDANGNRRLDEGETVLGTHISPGQIKISWRGMGSGNNLHFNSQGITFVSNGTFFLSHDDKALLLTINRLGKPKITAAK